MVPTWDSVYPPLEDSMQMVKVVKWFMGQLSCTTGVVVIDVGTGSGILLRSALRDNCPTWGLGIDVKEAAARATLGGLRGFEADIDVVVGNVLDWVRSGFRPCVVITNPPYLPGDWFEDPEVFGGPDGRLVIDAVVRWVVDRAVPNLVITQSSFSGWERTVEFMGSHGYYPVVIMSTHLFFEDIVTMAFTLGSSFNC
jgi:release factor glutamine methyltransferase